MFTPLPEIALPNFIRASNLKFLLISNLSIRLILRREKKKYLWNSPARGKMLILLRHPFKLPRIIILQLWHLLEKPLKDLNLQISLLVILKVE